MKQTDAFPVPTRTRRTTFSLPAETLDRIERLATRLGVSQSALLAELLEEPIAAMAAIIDLVPETGATPGHIRRAKGKSIDLIKAVVAQATGFLKTTEKEDASQAPAGGRPRPTPRRKQQPVRKRTSGRKR